MLVSSNWSYAQNKSGLGVRFSPDGIGLTGKSFLNNSVALEGQLNAGGLFADEGRSYTVVANLEYHFSLEDPRWRVFFGGGIYGGTWNHDKDFLFREGYTRKPEREAILGVNGIGGTEFFLKKIPVGISADFRPAINILSDVDFFSHNMFGLSVRYYFK